MTKETVGDGKVYLISGGGKVYTDIAARFCRSNKSTEEIIASEYDAKLVERILESGHLAATEFDYFIFGVEGYSRVTEAQLIRKRHANYLIKSGRVDRGDNAPFDFILPESLTKDEEFATEINTYLLECERLYRKGQSLGIKEEDLRYLKPQATEFKAIIGMNAHALLDWFKIRCCMNAQSEIQDLAYKMLRLCKEAAPDLFKDAGPSCKVLGYCPENKGQNKLCYNMPTKEDALDYLQILKEEYYQIPAIKKDTIKYKDLIAEKRKQSEEGNKETINQVASDNSTSISIGNIKVN